MYLRHCLGSPSMIIERDCIKVPQDINKLPPFPSKKNVTYLPTVFGRSTWDCCIMVGLTKILGESSSLLVNLALIGTLSILFLRTIETILKKFLYYHLPYTLNTHASFHILSLPFTMTKHVMTNFRSTTVDMPLAYPEMSSVSWNCSGYKFTQT